jgi:hypothetical protein
LYSFKQHYQRSQKKKLEYGEILNFFLVALLPTTALGIRMIWNLGLKNVLKITFKKGKLVHLQNLGIDINREIQELEQGKTYKYLGIEECEGIQHQQTKERLKLE